MWAYVGAGALGIKSFRPPSEGSAGVLYTSDVVCCLAMMLGHWFREHTKALCRQFA